MPKKCLCEASEVLIFPCSGGSNCGQIANQAAVKLTEDGIGKLFCLAGIGAHDTGMMDTAKAARKVVAIDGCVTACAKRTLEHAGVKVTDSVIVTDAGIKKAHNFNFSAKDVASLARIVAKGLRENVSA